MFNINKYLRCNCEFHKRNKCVYLQLNEQNCLFVVSGSISFGRHSIFKTDNYISTFCSTHLLHSVVNCPKFWCPSRLAWWLVTSVPRARTQISNVTIIHVGYSQGEPEPGWEGRRRGISFIIYISPGCLNELSDTAAVWGQPGPAQLSDPVYIEPQERSVSVSGFS